MPVRLVLANTLDPSILRAGMTVTVSIDTKRERDLAAMVEGVLARTLNER